MTKPKHVSVKIPFSGFYESSHDAEIDRAIESYFNREGDDKNHVPDDFYYSFNHHGDIRRAYARLYAASFADWFEGETGIALPLEFEEMQSPREYNFTTDRLFVSVPLKTMRAIRRYVPDNVLAHHIADNHTSRSGFISFYANDLKSWNAKPFATWDYNEYGTLIEAALLEAGVNSRNYGCDVMEPALGNGRIDDIVYPYLNAWLKEHPLETGTEAIKEAFDIPDDVWAAMSENEQESHLERFNALPKRCPLTIDLFKGA